ncbi:MAG: hypothetical protein AB8I69_00715 [Anaerolineae bacterium]
MDIWTYYKAITRRLLVWSVISATACLVLLTCGRFAQGIGLQSLAWGVIDASIAIVGGWVTRRRRAGLADPSAPEVLAREARNLRRILLVNTGLDVLYVAGGVALALIVGLDNLFWRGNGWGIVVQGGFLFCFDLLHALGVPELGVPGPESAP